MELDDRQIMQRVQAGQVECFDLLVTRYRGALIQAAYSKLGSQAWAEDVVQEAFLAAFAARHSYNGRFAFRTWLWTILLNLCRSQWRRRELRPREQTLAQPADWQRAGLKEPRSPEAALAPLLLAERRTQVHQLLARLPARQADALRLRFFGELTFEEIAAAMGSSVSSAKQRVRKGLATMARWLEAS